MKLGEPKTDSIWAAEPGIQFSDTTPPQLASPGELSRDRLAGSLSLETLSVFSLPDKLEFLPKKFATKEGVIFIEHLLCDQAPYYSLHV